MYDLEIFQSIRNGEVHSISTRYKDQIWYALMITFIIMIVQNSFTIIPLILVITLNYYLFGFLYGFLWSWISSIGAAMFVFYVIRFWFQDIASKKNHGELVRKIEERGANYIFYGRVLPFFPTSILNIIAGISNITMKSFLIGTSLGNFVYFFILSLIPFGLFSSNIHPSVIGAIIAMIFVLFYVVKKRKIPLLKKWRSEKER